MKRQSTAFLVLSASAAILIIVTFLVAGYVFSHQVAEASNAIEAVEASQKTNVLYFLTLIPMFIHLFAHTRLSVGRKVMWAIFLAGVPPISWVMFWFRHMHPGIGHNGQSHVI